MNRAAADNELVLTLFDKDGNVVTAQTDTDVEDLPKTDTDPADAYAMRISEDAEVACHY